MNRSQLSLSAVLLGSSLCWLAVPAIAQNDQGNANAPAATSQNNNAPSGSLVKSHGDWRSSELVGATVYNDSGNSVGTINDLLVSSDGTVSNAILSVGGFLGIGTKLVEVPFNKLKFVPSASNPASGSSDAAPAVGSSPGTAPGASTAPGTAAGGAAPANGTATGAAPSTPPAAATPAAQRQPEFSVTLPGATKDSLKSDPEFKFAD